MFNFSYKSFLLLSVVSSKLFSLLLLIFVYWSIFATSQPPPPSLNKKSAQSNIFSTYTICSFGSNTHIIKLCSLSSVYENEKKERKIINWRLLYLPSSKISSCVRTADTGLCLHTWAALLCQGDATYHDR